MNPEDTKEIKKGILFSKEAWLAFLAHAAIALVFLAPIAFTAASTVAHNEADRAIEASMEEVLPKLREMREKQILLSAEINFIKLQLDRINNDNITIIRKLEDVTIELKETHVELNQMVRDAKK